MRRLLLLFLAVCCTAQTYTARTDVTPQAYPSNTALWGVLTGAGTLATPSDFNLPILRVTDNSTTSQHGSGVNWIADCGGSAETSILDKLDDRFYVCETGQAIHIFSLAWPTVTELYGSYYVPNGSGGGANNLWFSRATNDIAYSDSLDGSGDLSIYQYDFTSAVTGPTIGNGKVTKLVDISSSIAALGGLASNIYVDDVSVANDDSLFGLMGSTTSGQGSSGACYVIVSSASVVTSYWNTCTGHWFLAGADQGTVSIAGGGTDTFTLHNVRISTSGAWMKVGSTTCLSTCTTSAANYFWEVGTGTVSLGLNNASGGCGHTAIGGSNWVNNCDVTQHQNFFSRSMASAGSSGTNLPTSYPSSTGLSTWDQHMTWPQGDGTPFLTGTDVSYTGGYTGMPATNAWDGEILGVATSGGQVWRFAHCYDTDTSWNFEAGACIGAGDSHYFMWAAEDNGGFGNTDGVSTSCTIVTNCRVDVLMVKLPQITGAVTGAVTCSGSVTLQ